MSSHMLSKLVGAIEGTFLDRLVGTRSKVLLFQVLRLRIIFTTHKAVLYA